MSVNTTMKLNEIATQRLLIIPIGPSGSGKSTLFKKLKEENPSLESFSFDTLRHEWYDPTDYNKAWQAASKDPSFSGRAQNVFREMIKAGKSVFVDNTNLSPKSRRFFIETAKKAGYRTVAYVFNVDVDTLLQRQKTRPDKTVPEHAVRQHVAAMKAPEAGEFDEIHNI